MSVKTCHRRTGVAISQLSINEIDKLTNNSMFVPGLFSCLDRTCRSCYGYSPDSKPQLSIKEIKVLARHYSYKVGNFPSFHINIHYQGNSDSLLSKFRYAMTLYCSETRKIWIKIMIANTKFTLDEYLSVVNEISCFVDGNNFDYDRFINQYTQTDFDIWLEPKHYETALKEFFSDMIFEYGDHLCFGETKCYFLHTALSHKNLYLFNLLLSLGCRIDTVDDQGNTIYHLLVDIPADKYSLSAITNPDAPFDAYRKIAMQFPEWRSTATTIFTLAYCPETPLFELPNELIHRILLLIN